MRHLKLSIANTSILVKCESTFTYSLLNALYGSMISTEGNTQKSGQADLTYTVNSSESPANFTITYPDQSQHNFQDSGSFLFQFEQDLVVQIQLSQPELFFLHSAILAFKHRGVALIAPSGSGKSTTTWGLIHEGFDYLTDEMCGIYLDTLNISPFSHAISLKQPPPAPYKLPEQTLKTSRAYNVPVNQLPCELYKQPLKLDTILYIKYSPEHQQPEINPVSSAESCSHLYTNSLNPLSHPQEGMDAAMEIALNTRAFTLTTCDLQTSCCFIKGFLEQLFDGQNPE